MTQVVLAHTGYLLVGIVHIVHLVNKPCVAVGIKVLYRNCLSCLQRHDEILGVEHIEHREEAVALHLGHIASSLSHAVPYLVLLVGDIGIYHLLIAAQLGSAIASDTLVIVRGLVLIESIRCEIEHTVVERLVAQDKFVGLGHALRSIAYCLLHKHIVVKVTLVDQPHIYEAQDGNTGYHHLGTHFSHLVKEEEGCTDDDDPERAPTVGREDCLSHLCQIAHQWYAILLRNLLQGMILASRHKVAEESARHQGKKGTETGCQSEADVYELHLLGKQLGLIHNALQCHHGQKRNGKLGYHEDGSHGSELGIHRHIVEEEIGKRHEVPTPREEDTQNGGCQECPLHRALHDKESQNEEHHHKGSYIYRATGTWLVAPVLTQLLIYLHKVGIGFLHGCLALAQRHRGSALGIRDEERPGFVDTITPLCDIVAVQSAVGLIGSILLYQLTLSSHGLLPILPCMIQVGQIETDTYGSTGEANRCSLAETYHLLLADGIHQEGNHHEEDDKEVIIGHLHMVGIDLEGGKDGGNEQTPKVFSPVSQHDTSYHRRQIGQSHDLPDMSCRNDDKEVGRECPDDGAQGCQRLSEIESPQQDIES